MNGSLGTVSMDAVQSGHTMNTVNQTVDDGYTAMLTVDSTVNYEYIAEMRAAFPGPVIDLENHYEGAHVNFNASMPLWNASDVRHGLYNAVLSGSCGFTYGAQAIWQMYAPADQLARADLYIAPLVRQNANESWRDALRYEGATEALYVRALLSDLSGDELAALQPNRSLVGTPAGSDAGDVLAFTGNRYVAALLGASRYLVYAGFGDAFAVDLARLGGHFGAPGASATARWYDPRTGTYQDVSGAAVVALEGSQTFAPPTSGDVENDWLLALTLAS